MLRRTFACLLFFCSLAASARAQDKPAGQDVLIFSNGDQLTGKLVQASGGKVTFKSEMAGEINVEWDKIKELRAAGKYAVLEKGFKQKKSRALNPAKIAQGTVEMKDQTISVQAGTAAPVTVSTKDADYVLDNATYEKDLSGREGYWAEWTGTLTAGATLVKATQSSETFTTAINLVRNIPNVSWLDPRGRSIIDFTETFGRVTQPGVNSVKTSIYHADAERDFYTSPKIYALINISYDHNFSQGLDLQQIYGGGFGITAVKDKDQQMDVKAQLQYETQSYEAVPPATMSTVPDSQLFGATLAEAYTRKFKTLTINEQLQLVPAFNVLADYSANAEAGILFPLYKRLSFTANAADSFLNDPAPGAAKNSFQFITGVAYKLR